MERSRTWADAHFVKAEMHRFQVNQLSLSLFALALSACGGGGGGSSSNPLPATPSPVATVASVSPAVAIVGTPTTFDVAGSDLPAGMRFALPGCTGSVETAGGGSTRRQFTCTPAGTLTTYKGQVAVEAGTPFAFSVSYQAPILQASASASRMLVVTADGSLYAWGHLTGDGTDTVALVPKKIGSDFVSAVAGESSVLAVKKDGTLWSWGYRGILGTTASTALSPAQVGSGYSKVAIEWQGTTSGEHAIGLKSDGSLWTWGYRSLPTGQYGHQVTPRLFASGFSDLGANDTALKADGSVWEWTVNRSVLLASDPPDNSFIPRRIGTGYTAIASGFNVTYGLKADGSLWNWGSYATRPIGSDNDTQMHFEFSSGVRAIATGLGGAMLIKTDNTLWVPGAPKPVQAGEYIAVWPDRTCTMAMKTDGTLWAWGLCYFGDGQFAHYTQPDNTPQQVILPK